MANLGRGSITRMLWQTEAAFKTEVAAADRLAWNMHFNSSSLKKSQPLGDVGTIRGDRNADEPFLQNIDVSGDIILPVDTVNIGMAFKHAVGAPTTTEAPVGSVLEGSGTATSVSNVCTFTVAQTTALVGDRLIYQNAAGTILFCYLTTKNSTTEWVISLKSDGTGSVTDFTAATPLYIVPNRMDTPGTDTIAITSGTATFSDAPTLPLAAGQQVIYNRNSTTGAYSVCYISEVLTTTTATVKTALGFVPANTTAVDIESIEAQPRWNHVYKVGATARLQSLLIEHGLLDLDTPQYLWYDGCKINTLDIAFGGDGELLATCGIVGANCDIGSTAYDATVASVDHFGSRYHQFQAAAERAGSAEGVFKTFQWTLNNNLDKDTATISSNGEPRHIAEGIAMLTGSLNALVEDLALQTVAAANTTTSLEIQLTSGSDTITFYMPECKIEMNTPPIPSPAGLTVDMNWKAFMTASNADDSLCVVTINNTQPAY